MIPAIMSGPGSRLYVQSGGGSETGPTRYTATHYVAHDADGTGDGSLGDPWTPEQAKGAVAGNVVCWLAGSGGLYEFACTDSENAAWVPTNSGSAGNPIIHYAEYSGPDLSTPASNANRTEVSHDGASDGSTTSATGRSSTLGNGQEDFIVFDGFVHRWANAKPSTDGGWYRLGGNGGGYESIQILNAYIEADDDAINGNYPAIWAEGIDEFRASGCVINGVRSTEEPTTHNTAAIITYGCTNMDISYNDLDDNQTAVYIKGTAADITLFNSGSVHHNRMVGCLKGMRLADIDATVPLEVHHNLVTEFSAYGCAIVDNNGGDGRNVELINNTFGNTQAGAADILFVSDTTGTGIIIRDNVLQTADNAVLMINAGSYTQAFDDIDYNYYAQTAGTFESSYNGGNETTIAGWRTRTGDEANSTLTSDNPFTNMAGGDYTVGGALLTGSSTGGELGAFEGATDPGRIFVSAT